jgi:hypothetical protein
VEQRYHEKAKRRASGGQARWAVVSFFPFRLSGISSCVREERNLTQRQNCHYTWLCALRPGAAVNNRQVTLQLLPITPNCVNPRPLDHTNANRIHTRFTSSHLPPSGFRASEWRRTRPGVRPHLRLCPFSAEVPVHSLQPHKQAFERTRSVSLRRKQCGHRLRGIVEEKVFNCIYDVVLPGKPICSATPPQQISRSP